LAIRGDPGVDTKTVQKNLDIAINSMNRVFTEGFGTHGVFPEGDGCSEIAANRATTLAMRALIRCDGKDYLAAGTQAQWMVLKWIALTVPQAEGETQPWFPSRGAYWPNVWKANGTFGQGFLAVEEKYRPALLWLYNRTMKPIDDRLGTPFDTMSAWPYRTVCSFLSWPIGMQEENPEKVLPKAYADGTWRFFAFRNRWQDADDIVVTAQTMTIKGNYETKAGPIIVRALKKAVVLPVGLKSIWAKQTVTDWGGTVDAPEGSLAVDFSGLAGGPLLAVADGTLEDEVKGLPPEIAPWQDDAAKSAGFSLWQGAVAGRRLTLVGLGLKQELKPKVEGKSVLVGKRRITVEAERLVLGE
jgi:hypothetical protein